MAINIKDPMTEQVIRELAALSGESITDAVRGAVEAMIAVKKAERDAEAERRREKNRQIYEQVRKLQAADRRPWHVIRTALSDGL